jgi:hypothetical protein
MSITALQRTQPLWRFLLNLESNGWGLAAEAEALGGECPAVQHHGCTTNDIIPNRTSRPQ